jgi:hypothetical protein
MKTPKLILLVLLLHIVLGFVTCNVNDRTLKGDPILVNKVQEVFSDAKRLGYKIPNFQSLTIDFEHVNPQNNPNGTVTIGFTTAYYTKNPTITINSYTWSYMSDTKRYLLIAHEVGHAIWQRGHDDTVLPDFTPKSIMAPLIFDVDIFTEKRDYYLSELFSKCCDI